LAEEANAQQVLRLCLDLNVWIGDLLARRSRPRGLRITAGRRLVQAAMDGRFEGIPVQTVVSWGMLNRLRSVLSGLAVDNAMGNMLIDSIIGSATLGPEGSAPYLLLGGAGVLAMHDEEDRHVLEVARATRAHVLATANFRDFSTKDSEILLADRVCIDPSPNWDVVVALPQEVAGWLRRGIFPSAVNVRDAILKRPGPTPLA
jgi:predicted nucleic acid-binding protein